MLFFSAFAFDIPKAEAATTFVALQTNQKSASTSRVNSTGKLSWIVNNVGSKTVHYNIFRNGVLHSTGLDVKPGGVINAPTGTVKSGEYSLRVYCGTRSNPQTSGCQAKATITGN